MTHTSTSTVLAERQTLPHRWLRALVVAAAVAAASSVAACDPIPQPGFARPGPSAATASATIGEDGAATAVAVLATLPVNGRAPLTGYDRALFGSAWTDDVGVLWGHNGCDTRSDILRRDLTGVAVKPDSNGCVPLSGTLADPYTDRKMAFIRGTSTSSLVQIDHVVSLGDAWQSGAQQLDETTRTALANDPLNLLAVDGPTNQQKSDSDAASWLPPNKAYRCEYVSRQVAVKAKYRLWIKPAEKRAVADILSGCPEQLTPDAAFAGSN